MSEQIEVIIGQPIQITLRSMMGSTGYGWYLSKLDGGLMLSSTTIQPTAVGVAPILHIFDFFAAEAGTFTLEFKLAAQWRPGEFGDAKTYEVTVKNPERTASEEIESAMKGGSFIDPSVLGANSATIIKYAAPMSQVIPANAGLGTYPNVVYAAPMSQAIPANVGLGAYPNIVYAAPMSQTIPSNAGLGAYPNVVYAAPMSQAIPPNTGLGAYPNVVYAAPMSQAIPANAGFGTYPSVIYAAPMSQAQAAIIQPYAAPFIRFNGSMLPVYAAPMAYSLPVYAAPMSIPGCC